MIIDDKKRVIGKVVSINSDRFSVELLNSTKNFNTNGYDDIHYFAQINSYVIVPYQNSYIVLEVISIREKDDANASNIKEQELNKINSTKYLEVIPIGTIKKDKFTFGASVYPTLYSDVLYIKDEELDMIFNTKDSESQQKESDKTILNTLEIGKSVIFQDYDIKIKINDFFGGHSAILGNTGSGKSCTISSMIQTLFKKENHSAVGANFIFFDVNGEYKKAFEGLNKQHQRDFSEYIKANYGTNPNIGVCHKSIENKDFTIPHNLMNVEEWELLLNASEKTQLPILRNALSIASIMSNASYNDTLDHIKAVCIELILNNQENDTSKSQKIKSILTKFKTDNFNLNTSYQNSETFKYKDKKGNIKTLKKDIKNCIEIDYGSMLNIKGAQEIISDCSFFKENIKPFENPEIKAFKFEDLECALELAILYEEANGNNQIRNYCASLLTRFQGLKNREEFKFLTDSTNPDMTADEYVKKIFGLDKSNKKQTQITIIDLSSAEDEIVEFISSVLTRLIFDALRKAKNRNEFPVNLVLEEAHRYIAYDSKTTFLRANKIFDRVAKEGRKYGLFFMISSQRPSELSKTVLSQCSNFIVHRIQNPDDLSYIRQATPHISESTFKKLPSISTQHALIFGSSVNIPVLFKVSDANPKPYSNNNDISKNWFVDKEHEFKIFQDRDSQKQN